MVLSLMVVKAACLADLHPLLVLILFIFTFSSSHSGKEQFHRLQDGPSALPARICPSMVGTNMVLHGIDQMSYLLQVTITSSYHRAYMDVFC